MYKKKYLKYKEKYFKLKQLVGGELTEEQIKQFFNNELADYNIVDNKDQLLKSIKTKCDEIADGRNEDNTICKFCPFSNAADNTNPNKCQKINGNCQHCFGEGRLDLNLYLKGHSTFTVENNINVTGPIGEVCFCNTITSCLTYCFITTNNYKISIHINPQSHLFCLIDGNIDALSKETVNQTNIFEKVIQELNKIPDETIKKVIILGATSYDTFKLTTTDNIYISENDETYCPNVVKYERIGTKYDKFKLIIKNALDGCINDDYHLVLKENIEIKKGSIYFVDAIGTGVTLIDDVRTEF
jgi:hypothetical protein